MDIYFSYACRESYLVYAWLKRVEKSRQSLDVNWLPFAIQMDDPNGYWTQPWESANSELRGFIAAEAARRQGSESFFHFHDALEQAVHEQSLELGDEATLIRAARQAGVAVDKFQADWHDPQLAETARRSHSQAVERWNVFGTPTLIFPDGRSVHLELNAIPSEADALEIFRAIELLVVTHPYIRKLQQTELSR